MNNYLILPAHLRPTADTAIQYFKQVYGVTNVKVEEPVRPDIGYKPTFKGNMSDHHILCVDIVEQPINETIIYFVTQCGLKGIPAKFYVGLPIDTKYSAGDIRTATDYGIGIIAVPTDGSECQIVHRALSLSLTGLRSFDPTRYPKRYRTPISNASETFRNGEPNKACGSIHDEIEDLTRRVVAKLHKKKMWQQPVKPRDVQTGSWASLTKKIWGNMTKDAHRLLPDLNDALLSRVQGITSYRNESSHKPGSKAALAKRDSRLRTRMENGADILLDLIDASKPLKP